MAHKIGQYEKKLENEPTPHSSDNQSSIITSEQGTDVEHESDQSSNRSHQDAICWRHIYKIFEAEAEDYKPIVAAAASTVVQHDDIQIERKTFTSPISHRSTIKYPNHCLKRPQIHQMKQNSITDTLFYIEMALCSVSDKFVPGRRVQVALGLVNAAVAHALMPIETDEYNPADGGGGDGGANSPGSGNSSEFGFISDFDLMGGRRMERVDSRVALLTPADLTASVCQLQFGHFFAIHRHSVMVVPLLSWV